MYRLSTQLLSRNVIYILYATLHDIGSIFSIRVFINRAKIEVMHLFIEMATLRILSPRVRDCASLRNHGEGRKQDRNSQGEGVYACFRKKKRKKKRRKRKNYFCMQTVTLFPTHPVFSSGDDSPKQCTHLHGVIIFSSVSPYFPTV